ncbi:hypothetical protein [Pseudonocardia sp. DLS-67]
MAPPDRLTLGTAPDSWGVWFPSDPHQVGWQQDLDEIAQAGYLWTGLGPSGFLPQDPVQLRDELDARGLRVCGGTVVAGLHRGAEALDEAVEPNIPLPIGAPTAGYFRGCGLGPVRRWPY